MINLLSSCLLLVHSLVVIVTPDSDPAKHAFVEVLDGADHEVETSFAELYDFDPILLKFRLNSVFCILSSVFLYLKCPFWAS